MGGCVWTPHLSRVSFETVAPRENICAVGGKQRRNEAQVHRQRYINRLVVTTSQGGRWYIDVAGRRLREMTNSVAVVVVVVVAVVFTVGFDITSYTSG